MDSIAAGALRLAAARGDMRTLELLERVEHFEVDAALLGFTPLMAAASQGRAQAAAWLLQRGASVRALKQDGWRDSVLHYAAARGCLDTAQVRPAAGPRLGCEQQAACMDAAAAVLNWPACPRPV
jgi:hypothetical protein